MRERVGVMLCVGLVGAAVFGAMTLSASVLYVADSQSSDKVNAPFHQGIRIGSVKDGKVTAFIAAPEPKMEMPDCVTADKDGNVFGGFTADVEEYVKK